MYGWFQEELKQVFEDTFVRTYILDTIISATEDFFEEDHIPNDYDPREGAKNYFKFNIGDEKFKWRMDPSGNTIRIIISRDDVYGMNILSYSIYIRYSAIATYATTPIVPGKHSSSNLDATKLRVNEDVFDVMKRYAGTLDNIVEQKKIIQEQFNVRTNPGMPCESTYVVDDFLHNFEMELSWMKSTKYVVERMDFEEFLKLEDQDLNYNGKLYRLADKSPATIARLEDRIKNFWMFGKQYRIENVAKNGLFYIENMDLQDVSECGYDTIDILCTGSNRYDVVELFIKSEENKNVQFDQESN